MQIKQSKCPICKTASFFFYKKFTYNCYVCDNCKTLFLHPHPIQKDIVKLYSGYNEINIEFQSRMKKRVKETSEGVCKMIQELKPNAQTLLEIGSGYGFFLDTAKKYFKTVTGIEPVNSFYKYSKNNLVLNVTKETYQLYFQKHTSKKYDVIILMHVIEHVLDPSEVFLLAEKHLNKNGVLFLETPNLNSYLFEIEKQDYTYLTPPEHVYLFSPTSFKYLLKDFPSLQIKKVTTYSLPEHFAGVVKGKVKDLLGKSVTQSSTQSSKKDALEPPVEVTKNKSLISSIKYLLFDKIFCGLFHNMMSFGNKGSMLQVYIVKN